MMMVLRRLLAAAAVATAMVIGSGAMVAQAAPTPSPTASASTPGTTATPGATPTDNGDTDLNITPDTALDNTRIVWVLGGVGLVAVIAAAVVIARR